MKTHYTKEYGGLNSTKKGNRDKSLRRADTPRGD
jgi:hypothetical protein